MFIFFYLLYNTDIIIKIKIKMQCVDDTSSSSPFLLLLIHVSWKNDLWSLDQIRPTCRSTLCVKMGHIALCCENRIFFVQIRLPTSHQPVVGNEMQEECRIFFSAKKWALQIVHCVDSYIDIYQIWLIRHSIVCSGILIRLISRENSASNYSAIIYYKFFWEYILLFKGKLFSSKTSPLPKQRPQSL